MIIRLKFSDHISEHTLDEFYKNPRGTCLASSSAVKITPRSILCEKGDHVSFWYIPDSTLIQYYGSKVCINSLVTYPGVLIADEILSEMKLSDFAISDMSEKELYNIFIPFA